MMKKFFVLSVILCAAFSFFTAKTFAAEFELVSYSAQVKLQWLATTGVPEAQKILKELGKTNIYGERNLVDYERLEKVNSIYQELCYAATVQYVQQQDYKNILDIGGGYTPRALVFAREGRKYFGGVKLGVRGLIDAYGETARKAIELAGKVERVMTKPVKILLEYGTVGNITRLLESYGALNTNWNYAEKVKVEADIPIVNYENIFRELEELKARKIIADL